MLLGNMSFQGEHKQSKDSVKMEIFDSHSLSVSEVKVELYDTIHIVKTESMSNSTGYAMDNDCVKHDFDEQNCKELNCTTSQNVSDTADLDALGAELQFMEPKINISQVSFSYVLLPGGHFSSF